MWDNDNFLEYDASTDIATFNDNLIELSRKNKQFKQKFNQYLDDIKNKNLYQFS